MGLGIRVQPKRALMDEVKTALEEFVPLGRQQEHIKSILNQKEAAKRKRIQNIKAGHERKKIDVMLALTRKYNQHLKNRFGRSMCTSIDETLALLPRKIVEAIGEGILPQNKHPHHLRNRILDRTIILPENEFGTLCNIVEFKSKSRVAAFFDRTTGQAFLSEGNIRRGWVNGIMVHELIHMADFYNKIRRRPVDDEVLSTAFSLIIRAKSGGSLKEKAIKEAKKNHNPRFISKEYSQSVDNGRLVFAMHYKIANTLGEARATNFIQEIYLSSKLNKATILNIFEKHNK